MGAAAYNRTSRVIREQIERKARPEEFEFMDHLNSLPKVPGAPRPFGPIQFVRSHGGWWAQCPVTGFGYFRKTLREAVCAFDVEIVGYEDGIWKAIPRVAPARLRLDDLWARVLSDRE